MKAAIYTRYGSPEVLQIKEVAKPTPKDNEILIRVYATPVGFGDIAARNFRNIYPHKFYMPLPFWFGALLFFGITKPRKKILGSEFAGTIEAVGKNVTVFKTGDEVYGYTGMNFGANAEYLCMPENGTLAIKPSNMTYEEAATIPYGAIMSTSLLGKMNIQRGQKVLINGASGGIGSFAVQFARYFGAEVTGVCGTQRLEFVNALGADKVIDYTKEDFTKNGETYDLIFDILGKGSFSRCKKSLKPHGRYLLASFKTKQLLQMLWTGVFGARKVICAMASEKVEDLVFTRELIEAGKIKTVIDRCYPLEQIAEAHRYVEEGRKKGHVVITVCHQNTCRETMPISYLWLMQAVSAKPRSN